MNDQNTPGSDPPAGIPEPGHATGERPDFEHTLPLPHYQGQQPGQRVQPGQPVPSGPPSGVPSGQPAGPPSYQQGPPSYTPNQPGPAGPASGGPGFGQGAGYGPGQGPGPYGGYGATGPIPSAHEQRRDDRRNGRPKSLLPLVTVVALLVGLVGGALGGVAVDQWNDANQEPGRTNAGLAGVDTVAKAPLPADNGSIASVAQKLLPSTVQIVADLEGQEGGATGSGFYLDKQGHVVTNNHVVQDAAEKNGDIEVIDHEGNRYKATVVGRSKVYDLAVLYIKDAPEVTPASLGTSTNLQIGEGVVAFGSPLGLSSTATSGIVSALDRPVTTGGSLGGESGNIGVGFAIPIEQVKVTADQILKDGEARYPVIGASVKSDGSGGGALIDAVEDGSPAADGGLKKGDVVTALDDRPITDSPTLIVAIRSHLPGDKVTLTVDRDGDEKKIDVTLDSKVG